MEWADLTTAILAGLGGAAHCAAMCGPMTLALGTAPIGSSQGPISAALRFNLGRISAYTLAAAAASGLAGMAVSATAITEATFVFRLVAASLLGLVGVGLMGIPGLMHLQGRLAPAWSVVRRLITPLTRTIAAAPPPVRPFLFGLLWLFMPCGLVYSMLLVAATRPSIGEAALLMLCFGLGTTPAVLSLSIAGTRLTQWLNSRRMRLILGILLVLAAIVSGVMATVHQFGGTAMGHLHHHVSA